MPCPKPGLLGLTAWLDCAERAARASPEELAARWRLETLRWPTWKRIAYAAFLDPRPLTVAWAGRRYEVVAVHQDRLILRGAERPVLPQEVLGWRVEPCAPPASTA